MTSNPVNTAETAPAPPLVDLQRLVVAIRRRRRMWLGTALAGLLVGLAIAVVLPSPPTAVAKLLVVHAEDSPTDPGTLMRTDVAVLQTTKIAGAALQSIHSTESADDFLKDFTGVGVTNNVLQITVKGSSQADALAKAKALGESFIADHVQRNQAAAQAQAQALLGQRDQAQSDLGQVDQQIAAESARGTRANATTLETLYSRRAELSSKISDFQTQAQQAGVGSPQIAAGTQIVDAPRITPHSLLKSAGTDGGIGLALGLVLGLAFAAVRALVRDRPVLRREISANLGASVIAQLRSRPRGLARFRPRTKQTEERRHVTATIVRLVKAPGGSAVSLLDLGAPDATAQLALDVAGRLAELGPTVVVDDLPKPDLAALATGSAFEVIGGDSLADPASDGRLRLGVGSVAPGTAWTDLSHLGTETVLVVRAGHADAGWLHTIARQLADCGITIIGVVVVDPDPKDRTDGTLWNGLHTALRGRAERASRAEETRKLEPVTTAKKNGKTSTATHDLPTRRFVPAGSGKD